MKKTLLIMVMALALLLTQCRKPEVKFPSPVAPEGTTVSMTVTAGPGGKTDISETGAITWSTGDKLYVGDGAKYIGCLTLQGAGGSATGTFSGDVTLTGITEGVAQTFHFFYLGSAERTLEVGATEATVSFASQEIYAEDSNLKNASAQHVGYGSANGTVTNGVVTGINVTLVSKVALARFSFTDGTTSYSGALTLSGVSNKMTVKFNGAGFSYEGSGDGISLTNTSASEKYVMLVPTGGTGDVALSFDGGGKTGGATIEGGIQSNKFYGKTDAIPVNLTAPAPTHEYVDFGLESGLLWATCNLGAEHPYDYGDYYAWGATETWYSAGGQSESPTWKDGYSDGYAWKHCPGNGGNSSYNADAFNTWKDANLTGDVLKPEVDAAHANWGEPWRMPTGGADGEWQELASNTYMKWEYDYAGTGVPGYIVYKVKDAADKGLQTVDANMDPEHPNWVTCDQVGGVVYPQGEYSLSDVHLFLPAAGCYNGTSFYIADFGGFYWSSSLYSSDPRSAYDVYFSSYSVVSLQDYYYRHCGYSVRPVRPAL